MKNVYILTKEQVEELKDIRYKIVFDIDIISDLLEDNSIKISFQNAIRNVLLRIESYCDNMEDILESE